jgi:eukaryotic-like serine/threonine-protein kinase
VRSGRGGKRRFSEARLRLGFAALFMDETGTSGTSPPPAAIERAKTSLARRGRAPLALFETGLPPDLIEDAANRLGVAAVLFAVGFFLSWTAAPPEAQPAGTFPMLDVAAVIAVSMSMALFWGSRRLKERPRLLHDVALGYEVACCLLVALSEQWLPWPPDHLVRGISWISLVLVSFPLAVPSTPAKTVFAAIAGASMGPLALGITILKGNPAPPAGVMLGLFLPTYLAAAIAYVLSRVIHRLGRDVTEARRVGAYQLEERLGRGGMGEVWSARHRLLARPAAVKLVRPDAIGDGLEDPATVLRRFEHEARATARLESPHTISLYDFGISSDGTFYYVMELLDGLDVESMVQRFGPLPAERAIHLLVQICHSLADAHHHGMIHRDIKPANIYVCRMGLDYDFVKVLDFGLVISNPAAAEQLTRLTGDGLTSGTPAFMAPEMADSSGTIDARADLYAVGCVAYWMLTGQLVFESSSPIRMLADHVQTAPIPPSQRTELEIPSELEAVVMSCLAKKPGDRPHSARELAHRLERCAIVSRWTNERAEKWWRTHMPKAEAATGKQDVVEGH